MSWRGVAATLAWSIGLTAAPITIGVGLSGGTSDPVRAVSASPAPDPSSASTGAPSGPTSSPPASNTAALAEKCRQVRLLTAKTPAPGSGGVVVVGDSYAQGISPRGIGHTFPTFVARRLDLPLANLSVGGTGFHNPGPCGFERYLTRIREALAYQPRLLIVEGGTNDLHTDPAVIARAAGAVLRRIPAGPRVVVVGPAGAPSSDPAAVDRVADALRAAAQTEGAAYVDLRGVPLTYLPGGLHPDTAGQRVIADLVVRDAPPETGPGA